MCCILIALLKRCNIMVVDACYENYGIRGRWLGSVLDGLAICGVEQRLKVFVLGIGLLCLCKVWGVWRKGRYRPLQRDDIDA